MSEQQKQKKANIEKEWKKKEKEMVKEGKTPYYLKKCKYGKKWSRKGKLRTIWRNVSKERNGQLSCFVLMSQPYITGCWDDDFISYKVCFWRTSGSK